MPVCIDCGEITNPDPVPPLHPGMLLFVRSGGAVFAALFAALARSGS